MWQFVVIYIIGVLVAILLLYKLYRFFFAKKTTTNPCAGCTGCDLHQLKSK